MGRPPDLGRLLNREGGTERFKRAPLTLVAERHAEHVEWNRGVRHRFTVDAGTWTRHPQTIRIVQRVGAPRRPVPFGRAS